MIGRNLVRFYVLAVAFVSMVSLVWVYAFPPPSMKVTRQGVAHFTPRVLNPETGEALSLDELIRHYRGD